jgi:hypothetical protein
MASNRNHDRLEELLNQAWSWNEADWKAIELSSGKLDTAASLVDEQALANHPFAHRSREDIENPHMHLLRVMRNPDFFPFTCKYLFGIELLPFQHVILTELWRRQFPMLLASRGAGKSFTLALYIMLRLVFFQGAKVVIVASAFRQAKVVFEYMENIWANSSMLRDLVGGHKGRNNRDNGPRRDVDRCEMIIGDSVCTALPLGDGKKIRGLRAHYTIAEEFASISEEVYTTVIQGFGAVSANPVQNVKDYARQRLMKLLGLWTADMDADEAKLVRGNQSVLSGTAYYSFNHFARYWREYKRIIESRGDPKLLSDMFKGEVPEGFDYRDYSIIRIPFEKLPRRYMDEKTIARARQTTHSGIFMMEYGAVFCNDSEGFFRRSLIEKCVVGKTGEEDDNRVKWPSAGEDPIDFEAVLNGLKGRRYIYGIDPASETDQFAIVILEVWPDHRRVVYCWTTSKSDHREKVKRGIAKDHDFYRYCVRKVRDMMKVFPCERLMVDHGGGGISLREAFGDPDKLQAGEQPIYEVIDPDPKNEKPTDNMPGLHLLELVVFRDNAWVVEANHGMKKDMEDRVLLFPRYDSIVAGLAVERDRLSGRVKMEGDEVVQLYDTLDDCVHEIEELKNELATIVITTTPTGNERFDTPEVKQSGGKKGRLRKDRYSALLMANMASRLIQRAPDAPETVGVMGGFITDMAGHKGAKAGSGLMYRADAPAWWQEKMGGVMGGAVVRGVR